MSTRVKRGRIPVEAASSAAGGSGPASGDEVELASKRVRIICRHGGCDFSVVKPKETYIVRQHEIAVHHTDDVSTPKKRCTRAQCEMEGAPHSEEGHTAEAVMTGQLGCNWASCSWVGPTHDARRKHRLKKTGRSIRHVRCRDNADNADGEDAACTCTLASNFPGCDAMSRRVHACSD